MSSTTLLVLFCFFLSFCSCSTSTTRTTYTNETTLDYNSNNITIHRRRLFMLNEEEKVKNFKAGNSMLRSVAAIFWTSAPYIPFCSGALVDIANNKYVLTAAHCIMDMKESPIIEKSNDEILIFFGILQWKSLQHARKDKNVIECKVIGSEISNNFQNALPKYIGGTQLLPGDYGIYKLGQCNKQPLPPSFIITTWDKTDPFIRNWHHPNTKNPYFFHAGFGMHGILRSMGLQTRHRATKKQKDNGLKAKNAELHGSILFNHNKVANAAQLGDSGGPIYLKHGNNNHIYGIFTGYKDKDHTYIPDIKGKKNISPKVEKPFVAIKITQAVQREITQIMTAKIDNENARRKTTF